MLSVSEFRQYVVFFFDNLRKSAENVHSLQWGEILLAVQDLEEQLIHTSHWEIFCEHLPTILLQYVCSYTSVLVRLLFLYIVWRNEFIYLRAEAINSLRRRSILLGIAGPWCRLEPMVEKLIHPMTTFRVIMNGDLNFMVVLVRNGLNCLNFPHKAVELKEVSNLLAQNLWDTELGTNMIDFSLENNREVYWILVKIILYPYWFGLKAISFQRILMIIWVLEAVRRRLVRIDPDLKYVRCLRLLFDTISEPFISVGEVQSFLHDIFIAVPREIQDAICDDIREIFPESVVAYQPRKLFHLSRCKIRRSLLGDRTLPIVVSSLDIPRVLKDYLLVADIQTLY